MRWRVRCSSPYRVEAYTPAPKRVRGYCAMPLLWRDQVVGWGNLAVKVSASRPTLDVDLGFVGGRAPRESGFSEALDEELGRMPTFLDLGRSQP